MDEKEEIKVGDNMDRRSHTKKMNRQTDEWMHIQIYSLTDRRVDRYNCRNSITARHSVHGRVTYTT